MLAVMILIAAGIRLIYILLVPVAPYLLAGLIAFTVARVIAWFRRDRW